MISWYLGKVSGMEELWAITSKNEGKSLLNFIIFHSFLFYLFAEQIRTNLFGMKTKIEDNT